MFPASPRALLGASLLCAASVVQAAVGPLNETGTYQAIMDPPCFTPSFFNPIFAVGGNFTDSHNGLPQNQFSMLLRWQDYNKGYLSYDMGAFTALHSVPQPGQYGNAVNDPNGAPGAQYNCYDIGMLVNSWETPHRPIVGGGYNDMWGYSWPAGSGPRPFFNGVRTHLVVQANVGVNEFTPRLASTGQTDPAAGTAQAALFAYVHDTTHPSLPPIAILATVYDSVNEIGVLKNPGVVDVDYTAGDIQAAMQNYPNWYNTTNTDTNNAGVWFASTVVSRAMDNTQTLVDTLYTRGELNNPMQPVNHFGSLTLDAAEFPFFRAHITADNMEEIARRINTSSCPTLNGHQCLPRGYSASAADYELLYAGLIAETTITGDTYDVSPTSWIANDSTKNQVSFGLRGYQVGIYRYIP